MKTKRLQRVGYWSGVVAIVGVVASPVIASAASQSANTTINATLGSSISVSTSTTVAISATPTSGGVVSSNSDSVTVSTNNTTGYNLTLADGDATRNLVSGSNNIVPEADAPAAASTLDSNAWGFALASGTTGIGTNTFDSSYSAETNNASSTSKWAGIPATGSPFTLKTTSSTASNDATTVWYAIKVTTSQPNGTYSDTVTYTATTN
jgi:hypothetical protein